MIHARARNQKHVSQCPFQLLTRGVDGRILSSATAFFFETDGNWFLITNWHVVSGRHFMTREPLAKTFRRGHQSYGQAGLLRCWQQRKGRVGIEPLHVPLYRGEQPVWFEHPTLGTSCDVVAIPMDRPDGCPEFMHNAANRISDVNIPVEPGCTVFVIGFPHALSIGFGLPLWKSGFVASEPHYDVDLGGKLRDYGGLAEGTRIPAFFVDAQTRAGMSGSPVFADIMDRGTREILTAVLIQTNRAFGKGMI